MIKMLYKLGGIIIKQSAIKVLDDKDLEFVEALRSLDVARGVAALITYLASVDEATSREIEMGTDLRQPEVSIGMRTLHENNWVAGTDIKGEGNGRPRKVYSLSVSLDEIVKHYEDEKGRESAIAMEAIQRLREIAAI